MRGLLVVGLVTAFVATVCTGHLPTRSHWRRPVFNLARMNCDRIKIADLCHCCKDPCDDVECLNNGVCVDGICNCPCGFSGADCGVDLCAAEPCQNDGTCVPEAGGVSCKCVVGFTGELCGKDECEPNPCQNCGTCSRIEGGFKCTCLDRINGTTCEVIDNIITTQNYPNNYPAGSSLQIFIPECFGKQIRMVFDDDFVLQKPGTPQCEQGSDLITGDFFTCKDGVIIDTQALFEVYCGGTAPPTVTSRGNFIVDFTENGDDIQCKGFKLSYTYVDA
ncbi:hypothetical protein SNE40_017094 [Patella caerulea]|uniref:Uncharacterized protein n=1 Tax=Patella caerulea TaxID=87958 RepID=A0AAN8J9R3_PATCE